MLRLTQRFALAAAGLMAGLLTIACSGLRIGPPTPVSGPLGKPDFTLTSKEYVQEFDDNLMAATDKYKNKVVEITGTLMAFGYEADGKPFFALEGPRPQPGGLWAGCQMSDKYPWTKASTGQTVTIKGRGHPVFRSLVDCEVVTVKGDPAPRLTADEYAKRADDPKLFKNGPKCLIVSGEILDKRDQVNPTSIYLKCQDDKKKVHIHFSPKDYQRLNVANWKAGQKIEVIGNDSTNPGYPWLVDCVPMSDPK
jgi:hypothetical protein